MKLASRNVCRIPSNHTHVGSPKKKTSRVLMFVEVRWWLSLFHICCIHFSWEILFFSRWNLISAASFFSYYFSLSLPHRALSIRCVGSPLMLACLFPDWTPSREWTMKCMPCWFGSSFENRMRNVLESGVGGFSAFDRYSQLSGVFSGFSRILYGFIVYGVLKCKSIELNWNHFSSKAYHTYSWSNEKFSCFDGNLVQILAHFFPSISLKLHV